MCIQHLASINPHVVGQKHRHSLPLTFTRTPERIRVIFLVFYSSLNESMYTILGKFHVYAAYMSRIYIQAGFMYIPQSARDLRLSGTYCACVMTRIRKWKCNRCRKSLCLSCCDTFALKLTNWFSSETKHAKFFKCPCYRTQRINSYFVFVYLNVCIHCFN